jgi:hypothetical protein
MTQTDKNTRATFCILTDAGMEIFDTGHPKIIQHTHPT